MGVPVLQETYSPQYGDRYIFYRCPECRELYCTERVSVYGDREISEERYPHARKMRYCPVCGQEIIWREMG